MAGQMAYFGTDLPNRQRQPAVPVGPGAMMDLGAEGLAPGPKPPLGPAGSIPEDPNITEANTPPRLGDGSGADPRISVEQDIAAYETLLDWLSTRGFSPEEAGNMTINQIFDMIQMGAPGNQQLLDAVGTASSAYGNVPVEDPAMGGIEAPLRYIPGR